MTPEMLTFLDDEDQQMSAWNFAELANAIPVSTGDYNRSSAKVWTVYQHWLENAELAPSALSESEQKLLAEAEQFAKDNQKKYLECRSSTATPRPSSWRRASCPRTSATGPRRRGSAIGWRRRSRSGRSRASAIGTRAPAPRSIDLGRRDLSRAKKRLSEALGESKDFDGKNYRLTTLFPTDFWKGTTAWTKFVMTDQQINEFKHDHNVNFGGKAGLTPPPTRSRGKPPATSISPARTWTTRA